MKKIAILIPDLSLIGAQRVAVDYGKELSKRGYAITIVSGDTGVMSSEVSGAIFIYKHKYFGKIPVLRFFESLVRLAWHFIISDYELIISVAPFLNRVACVYKALHFFSATLILEDHACPPYSYKDEFSKLKIIFYKKTEFFYRKASKIRVLSKESRDYYKEIIPGNNVVFMPNFMDFNRIIFQSKKDSFTTEAVPYICYIGRYSTQKNIAFLILAFHSIIDKIPHNLIIIGYGPEEDNLASLIKLKGLEKRVFLRKNSVENFKILAAAALFPMTSLWEGMPLTLIESMVLGTPVLVTNFKAGPDFLIGNNVRGKIIDTEIPAIFGYAIIDCLTNTEETNMRKENAIVFVKEKLSIESNMQSYIDEFLT